MFDYNPKDAISCLPEGEATLAIKSAEDKVSKAGNDMVEIKFDAFMGDRKGFVTEYVVNPATLYKLKQIAKALGPEALAEFERGTFDPAQHIGDTLQADLVIESDDFGDKNRVKKYLVKNGSGASSAARVPDPDVPF